jgi:hypothetical protein
MAGIQSPAPNTRVQRTRSSASALRSPLTPHPLGGTMRNGLARPGTEKLRYRRVCEPTIITLGVAYA